MDSTACTDESSKRRAAILPPELDHSFRLIAFDWDGTAVASRGADATRVVRLLDRLLAIGARVAIVTGTNLTNVRNQLGEGVRRENGNRLFVAANRGSEVFGFDPRGEPVVLFSRVATPEENAGLDAVIEELCARLTRLTQLRFATIHDRLNRRKLDLIPEPAWADPPKSMIGELLAATEARLRGAGLRHGLREAFELTERLVEDYGLDARVTSDVKHIEVGLTDKADAVAYLFRYVAKPLRIAASDVLLLGDEFGPIAGFEGSDAKMLGVPEVAGAAVVSVGPEPGGAPRSVLHLGGGPDRFCDVLEHQLALEDRLGAFAVPRDAAWLVEESGFDVAREHEIESLLAIANGYVGSRGSLAEGSSVSRPATFLAGAFEPSADLAQVPELVITPDWGRLRFTIEGEPFAVETSAVLIHRRILDLRRGLLLREGLERGPNGHVTHLRTMQLASLADRHLLIEGVELAPQNFSGSIRVDAILSGDVKSASGAAHWASFEPSVSERGSLLVGRTKGGLVAALASHVELAGTASAGVTREMGATWAAERCDVAVKLTELSRLYRTVALYTSRDVAAPGVEADRARIDLSARPIRELVQRHVAAWEERWRRADVVIDGAPKIERALRFAIYHLIAAANPNDPRCSIGARSLSGEAYRGHVFWDTEIFMLPFYAHCYPEAARSLLEYRHHTLGGARRKAQAVGCEGALYAWESADTGDETTPAAVLTPFGEIIRVLSGEQEQHISADVAYAVAAYVRATGDREFLRRYGLEILVETARFWASRGHVGVDGMFHIDKVIGPDEYHEEIDDNAFTNWMARFNLRAAADAIASATPREIARLRVTPEEGRRFRQVADAIYLGADETTGIVEQFRGFYDLERIDLTAFGPRHAPMDAILGRARTQASQVVKQADVVQLIALLWDELTPAARRDNFLYYEPLTAHGSSLSPGSHALVAARLGLHATAERYLDQTADIDLGNTMGNAAGGVHAAAMGSLWQAVVFGVGGVRADAEDDEAIHIEPNLLPSWRRLAFPIAWRGRQLEVQIEPSWLEVGVEGDAPLPLFTAGRSGRPRSVRAEPGKRYAARRRGDDVDAWEEIAP